MTPTHSFHDHFASFPMAALLPGLPDEDFRLDQIELLAGASERPEPVYRRQHDAEAMSTLCELPPGPWRSLGRYLDYTNWPDRERFVALDRAIAKLAGESA